MSDPVTVPSRAPLPRPENQVMRLVVGFYLVMGGIGAGLAWWRRDSLAVDPFGWSWEGWPIYLAVTVGLAVLVHLLTRAGMSRFASLRQSGRDIRGFLGNLRPWQVGAVALASGLGEELLFRAWLLNEIGLVLSSIIFGLVHLPPSRKWLYWPVFAIAMGFVLGWLFLWTGSLVYPVLLHAAINYLNIRLAMTSTATRGGTG